MPKILVKNPIVDINGDEMARVLWHKIKTELILPYLDIKLIDYDLSIISRDKTNDNITVEVFVDIICGIKSESFKSNSRFVAFINVKSPCSAARLSATVGSCKNLLVSEYEKLTSTSSGDLPNSNAF